MRDIPRRPRPATAIDGHIERHIGPVDFTLLPLGAGTCRIAIQHVSPSERVPFHALVTRGMSAPSAPRATELFLLLPRWWHFEATALVETRWRWPIMILRALAMSSLDKARPIGCGDIVGGDFPRGLGFRASLLTLPVSLPEGFARLRYRARWIDFHQVTPLYEEEVDFARAYSVGTLVARFCQYRIPDVVLPGRRNVCGRADGRRVRAVGPASPRLDVPIPPSSL